MQLQTNQLKFMNNSPQGSFALRNRPRVPLQFSDEVREAHVTIGHRLQETTRGGRRWLMRLTRYRLLGVNGHFTDTQHLLQLFGG